MYKWTIRLIIPTSILLSGLVLTQSSFATAEYTKKEKKACTVCHVTSGKKDLNDVGKCYAEHNHSLEGCIK